MIHIIKIYDGGSHTGETVSLDIGVRTLGRFHALDV